MPNTVTTLLNNVSVDTLGTAVEITGDFDLKFEGFMGEGRVRLLKCEIQAGVFVSIGPEGESLSPGWRFVKNTGANWFRAQLVGAAKPATCTVKISQP